MKKRKKKKKKKKETKQNKKAKIDIKCKAALANIWYDLEFNSYHEPYTCCFTFFKT